MDVDDALDGVGEAFRPRGVRAPVEHGFADLKCWRILTKVWMNARHAILLLRALLALTNTKVAR